VDKGRTRGIVRAMVFMRLVCIAAVALSLPCIRVYSKYQYSIFVSLDIRRWTNPESRGFAIPCFRLRRMDSASSAPPRSPHPYHRLISSESFRAFISKSGFTRDASKKSSSSHASSIFIRASCVTLAAIADLFRIKSDIWRSAASPT